jgi:hypothetical protein
LEINTALVKLKNNKAAGSDSIPADSLKFGAAELNKRSIKLYARHGVGKSCTVNGHWSGAVCLLHKKGDLMVCNNNRTITLLNTAYKVVSNIVFNHLFPHTGKVHGNYDCRFQPGRRTISQIFAIRQILEKTNECNISLHHLFIDLTAAYDKIKREKLCAVV